jgi:hypothetical protein
LCGLALFKGRINDCLVAVFVIPAVFNRAQVLIGTLRVILG